ncbi:hypothetical protein KHS38_21585 [Mucilaginibacter sp. Bleaf8]|uniref:hypothetical protein n=1 Tax=Mucilaginibacter sp. Bleaf8 TaxID=2834430 RepID=UPI001BCE3BD2|nr:hypothetical protein [Mucilaginibacter sp. Bleaf8]MBS7567011.1 hypothetical protein [Mucilaginibacter sp. Bleaf8]
MNDNLNPEKPHLRLRAFRAIDEPRTCELFIEGHTNVLTSIGVTKVTSSRHEWQYNPAAFVIVVESLDGEQVYGGARVHVAGGTQPLPIEEATGAMDNKIFEIVWKYAQQGTGEICGLWNSPELAGFGIGSPLLIRTGIALCTQIGLHSLFALCAPYTVKPVVNSGMELIHEVGNEGTFYYPKLDLVATAMMLKNVTDMPLAKEEDRAAIWEMRQYPNNLKIDKLKDKDIVIDLQLEIPNLYKWDLAQTIASANKKFLEKAVDLKDLSFF